MENEKEELNIEEDSPEMGEINSVWDLLTPEQKKYFLKLNEKSEDNLRYIG